MIIFTNLCLSVSLLSSGILDCAPDMTVLSIFMLTHYIHCSEAVHVNVPWFEGLDLCCSEINCLCFQRLLWGITSSISPVTQRPMSRWKQREVLGVCSHANLALGSPLQQMLLFLPTSQKLFSLLFLQYTPEALRERSRDPHFNEPGLYFHRSCVWIVLDSL